jgi:hypothetical protein
VTAEVPSRGSSHTKQVTSGGNVSGGSPVDFPGLDDFDS